MTRNRIAGSLDLAALALLSADPRDTHRPEDPQVLAREAARLIGDGLSILDVAAALHLSSDAVVHLLDQSTDNLEASNASQ